MGLVGGKVLLTSVAVMLFGFFEAKAADPNCIVSNVKAPSSLEEIRRLANTPIASPFESAKQDFLKDREERLQKLGDPKHAPLLLDHGKETEYVVVLTHGLFDSPNGQKVLGDVFFKKGMNVLMPLLPKHWEKDIKSIDKVTAEEMMAEQEKAVALAKRLGKKVIVVGHSTGGLLAARTALRDRSVAGVMLYAPALELSNRTYAATAVGRTLGLSLNTLHWSTPDAKTTPYFSPQAGREVGRLVQIVRDENAKVNTKTASAEDVYKSIGKQIDKPVALVVAKSETTTHNKTARWVAGATQGPKSHLRLEHLDHAGTGRIAPEDMEKINDNSPASRDRKKILEHAEEFVSKNFPTAS
jgi:alpha-beta hydrolase superfamily lysophospholipase